MYHFKSNLYFFVIKWLFSVHSLSYACLTVYLTLFNAAYLLHCTVCVKLQIFCLCNPRAMIAKLEQNRLKLGWREEGASLF